MKMEISFTVPGTPIPQSRPRFTRQGHAYDTAKCREYKKLVALNAKAAMAGRELMNEALSANLTFNMPIPASWSKKKKNDAKLGRIIPLKGDLDNLVKAVLDACNGIVYTDDSKIFSLIAAKWYDEEPCVKVEFDGG